MGVEPMSRNLALTRSNGSGQVVRLPQALRGSARLVLSITLAVSGSFPFW